MSCVTSKAVLSVLVVCKTILTKKICQLTKIVWLEDSPKESIHAGKAQHLRSLAIIACCMLVKLNGVTSFSCFHLASSLCCKTSRIAQRSENTRKG